MLYVLRFHVAAGIGHALPLQVGSGFKNLRTITFMSHQAFLCSCFLYFTKLGKHLERRNHLDSRL